MRRTLIIGVLLAVATAVIGCGRASSSFFVSGLAAGQRVVLYDAVTGERLAASRRVGKDGVATVPIRGEQRGVFALCTYPDGVTGCGVASREMTVVAGETFSYAVWRRLRRRGKVQLYFDDGARSVWLNGRALFREFGVRVIVPVVTASASAASTGAASGQTEVMSWSQLAQLASDGHEIVSHTRTHPHLTRSNDSKLVQELAGSLQDLRAHGYRPVELVYPFGERDARVIAMTKRYYARARGGVGYNDLANPHLFDLASQDGNAGSSSVAEHVDYAVNHGAWLNLMYHGIAPDRQDPKTGAWLQSQYDVHPNVLRAELAHLIASGASYAVLPPRR